MLGTATGPEAAPDYVVTPAKVFSEVVGGWSSSSVAYLVRSDGTLWGAGQNCGAASGSSYPEINKYRRVYFGDKPAEAAPEGNTDGLDNNKPGYGNSSGAVSGADSGSSGSGSSSGSDTQAGAAIGSTVKVGGTTYKVTSASTVAFAKAKNAKSITVPITVSVEGKAYKVTAVGANAFKGSKIRTVTISKNIKTISANAFKGSKATKLVVKTKSLTKKTVKNSLKGSKIKTVQVKVGSKKVNKTYVKKYKKIFTKVNAGKKVSIKSFVMGVIPKK